MKINPNGSVRSVEEITVIEVVSVIGEGTEEDPARYLNQYWRKDGKLLAEYDTINSAKGYDALDIPEKEQ